MLRLVPCPTRRVGPNAYQLGPYECGCIVELQQSHGTMYLSFRDSAEGREVYLRCLEVRRICADMSWKPVSLTVDFDGSLGAWVIRDAGAHVEIVATTLFVATAALGKDIVATDIGEQWQLLP